MDVKSNMLALGSITAACTFLATLPFTTNAASISKGEVVFQQTCAGCHKGGSNNAIGKERTLTKEDLEKFLGLENENDISRFARDSNEALVFSARLTDEDYVNVAVFVYDQAMKYNW